MAPVRPLGHVFAAFALGVLAGCRAPHAVAPHPSLRFAKAHPEEPVVAESFADATPDEPPILADDATLTADDRVDLVSMSLAPKRRDFARRASVEEPISFDYAALPLMASEAPLGQGASFELVRHDLTPRHCPSWADGRRLVIWSMSPIPSESLVARVGQTALPVASLRLGFTDQDGSVDQGILNAPIGVVNAEWTSIDDKRRTADDVGVTWFEGGTDPEDALVNFQIKASSKLAGRATALVPGVLYAYRRCVLNCGSREGSAARVEELGLIGPPSRWVGTSSGVISKDFAVDEPFTHVRTRISRGSSATASIAVTSEDLARFRKDLAPKTVDAPAITYSVEVVWPDGRETPQATLFVGAFDKPDQLVDARLHSEPWKDPYAGQCMQMSDGE